jgi:para-nitrobenzyl esterase
VSTTVHAQVTTVAGALQGAIEGDVEVYRGIPFAADAGGANRFRPPQPVTPWEGVRDATHDGPASIQMTTSPPQYRVQDEQSEDCLSVNVWTPDSTRTGLPVFVFFHGGAWIAGSNAVETYNCGEWARRGIVGVTMNYRLGGLGFLYLDELVEGADATGILGALDLVAGLEWIRDNIAAFGGDPGNVTISGSSAGGGMVNALLGMPEARGLFQRAFPMSISDPRERQDAEGDPESRARSTALAAALLDRIGATGESLEQLQARPASDFRLTQDFYADIRARGLDWLTMPVPGHPRYPEHYFEALRRGDAKDVQLLAGVALDENGGRHTRADEEGADVTGVQTDNPVAASTGEDDLLRHFRHRRVSPTPPPTVDEVIAVYGEELRAAGRPDDLRDIDAAAGSDAGMVYSTMRRALLQAEHRDDTYFLLFAYPSPKDGGIHGAFHGVATPLLFHRPTDPNWAETLGSPPPVDMADAFFDALVAFVATGDPNAAAHTGSALPHWEPFTAERRTAMVVDVESRLVDNPLGRRLALHGI